MSTSPIYIVGAGLAGVTLSRCLLKKGIRSVITEKTSTSQRRHNYSIDLYSWAYKPLLSVLGLDEAEFKKRLSARRSGVGTDGSPPGAILSGEDGSQAHFRCHRGRLESLLSEGLDIQWDKTITKIDLSPRGVIAKFEHETPIETAVLVAADGVHSTVRKSLIPGIEPDVHPFVVFYGTRRIPIEQYTSTIAPQMDSGSSIESRRENVLLRIFINNTTSTHVDIGYTYSRSAHTASFSDPLYNPHRPTTGARDIPNAFYEELASLKDLGLAYDEIFHPAKIRQDRVLHWLMRSVCPCQSHVQSLAERGILMIGDAVHAMPILGGEGGNLAIADGVELAEWIAANGIGNFSGFVKTRYPNWRDGVGRGVHRLSGVHGEAKPSL